MLLQLGLRHQGHHSLGLRIHQNLVLAVGLLAGIKFLHSATLVQHRRQVGRAVEVVAVLFDDELGVLDALHVVKD